MRVRDRCYMRELEKVNRVSVFSVKLSVICYDFIRDRVNTGVCEREPRSAITMRKKEREKESVRVREREYKEKERERES